MGNLVEIARFYEPEEAFCASSYLQSFDIVVIIQNEYHLTIDPAMRIGLGGFRLLVSSEAATSATSHLADVKKALQNKIGYGSLLLFSGLSLLFQDTKQKQPF